MTTKELYTKGARVWVRDPEEVWVGAEVVKNYEGKQIVVALEEGGEEKTLKVPSDKDLPPLRNPDILVGENDLTSLSYLHEPAVLYNLKVRFLQSQAIYTYCGIVLVAINPYEELPIYGNDIIYAYSGQNMGDMDPHVYAIAEEAYSKMCKFEQNQSIIVTGESGAGKTVSAKYAMRYFATVGGGSGESETHMEKRVLASNPIMEAIGNAKTIRNDNSSRFGKYIQIGFNRQNTIIGANMRTYLLEKSRVVFQASEERNYHIFYQLCSQHDQPEYKDLKLNDADYFLYTNQGESPVIDGVDDADQLDDTKEAFSLLGISETHQTMIFRVLAAILHFGNVDFIETENEGSKVSPEDDSLPIVAQLLGIDGSQMKKWLCNRKIATVNEVMVKPLTKPQAFHSRDALVKHIYAQIFDWIVDKINFALHTTQKENSFIGVLDIYGFEMFDWNSFEQFCINYANEKLQQQFTQHVFKLEQEEYVREQIEWSFIDFYDNQPCIDLIESKLGILDLLDEECKMPKGNDANWCLKLYDKHLEKSNHFAKPRTSRTAFIVLHFADKVEYQVQGFLEKNRDMVIEDHLNILKASQFEFVAALFREKEPASPTGKHTKDYNKARSGRGSIRSMTGPPLKGGLKQHKQTVGSQFRDSLTSLMKTLNATNPHYIRCIKPNDSKTAFEFEPKRAVEQLRACGVLETIRISSAGYPSRWSYPEFFTRYRVLMRQKEIDKSNFKHTCETVLNKYINDDDKYQFGKTKIFFRAGQVAYLEKLRADKLRDCCILMQKIVRGWVAKRKYQKIKKSALLLQCQIRGILARRLANFLKRTKCATKIQKMWRGFRQWRRYQRLRALAIVAQSYARGQKSRKIYRQLVRQVKAVIIQKHIRGWLARRWYAGKRKQIILVQCCIRRRRARKELKQLKIEARSVEHYKKLTRGMENKVISLQQKLDELNKENKNFKEKAPKIQELEAKVATMKVLETEAKTSTNKITDLEEEIARLRKELEDTRKEKASLEEDTAIYKATQEQVVGMLKAENTKLQESLKEAEEKVYRLEESQKNKEQKDMENSQLAVDYEEERAHHQKLLNDYSRLEQRYENLQEEMRLLSSLPGNKVKRTPSNVSYDMKSDDGLHPNSAHRDTNEIDRDVLLKSYEDENQKLRAEVLSLKEAFLHFEETKDENAPIRALLNQVNVLNEENEKHRHEVINLKSKLANTKRDRQTGGVSIGVSTDFELFKKKDPELLNEDGELQIAYLSQKQTIQLLEKQLQAERKNFSLQENELKEELERLQKDNHRQQKIIAQNLQATPETRTSANLQHEINRLTNENLELKEQMETYEKENRKLKKQLKLAAKRLQSRGVELGDISSSGMGTPESYSTTSAFSGAVPRKDHVFMGMFAYKQEDEPKLVRNLVMDFKPQMAEGYLPGLPAYIIFMCLRHADYTNDDMKVKSLLSGVVNGIKKTAKKRNDDFESIAFFLVNTCRVMHNLKQYSGEEIFSSQNTNKQNGYCLRNFDLSEYRQVTNDLAVHIYQGMIRAMEKRLQTMIVPGMLEHEGIAGVMSSKPMGMRGRTSSVSADDDGQRRITIDTITKQLSIYLAVLHNQGLDPQIVMQVFKQLFYLITASTLNNLVLRKEMCHWSKGMQIRYNLSELEEWLRSNRLMESGAVETLEPLVQVSQLLQVNKKSDQDIESICELCTKLSTQQIVKILNLYTPVNEFESRVEASFVRKVQETLRKARGDNETQKLLMDTKFSFPVTFPYNPSSVELDTITIPEHWNLGFLEKV
ncbi:unconventional myosin-Va-like isoform X2 [Ptychodera flava]|uniref:unconventional myosin-Va-like isoform X2 n=1 Tax=Ptychodera flava TaxID=63121 RepID=UPI00396A19A4